MSKSGFIQQILIIWTFLSLKGLYMLYGTLLQEEIWIDSATSKMDVNYFWFWAASCVKLKSRSDHGLLQYQHIIWVTADMLIYFILYSSFVPLSVFFKITVFLWLRARFWRSWDCRSIFGNPTFFYWLIFYHGSRIY